MKTTQFAEKMRELGYHVTEHISLGLGFMCVWKHGDYVGRINYRERYIMPSEYTVPDDIKNLIRDYSDI